MLAIAVNNSDAAHDIGLFTIGKAEYEPAVTEAIEFAINRTPFKYDAFYATFKESYDSLSELCQAAEPSNEQLDNAQEALNAKKEANTYASEGVSTIGNIIYRARLENQCNTFEAKSTQDLIEFANDLGQRQQRNEKFAKELENQVEAANDTTLTSFDYKTDASGNFGRDLQIQRYSTPPDHNYNIEP